MKDKIPDNYKLLFNVVLHESKAVWDTGQVFLLVNTILVTIIATNISNTQSFYSDKQLIFYFLSILGVVSTILWLVSFRRVKEFYRFRMNQAKELENEFEIFSGDAEKLSGGYPVYIKGEKYQLEELFGIKITSFKVLQIIIILFFIFYLSLVLIYLPRNFISIEILKPNLYKMMMNNKLFWNIVEALAPLITTIIAIFGLKYVLKTWNLEKKPVVHAVGAFFISKSFEANTPRDNLIKHIDTSHTFQLINVGRGPARNVIPSFKSNIEGYLLEENCPHSFSIPSNNGTKILGEILRVHGQRFVKGNKYELEVKNNSRLFYIYYEDHEGKEYSTKVEISKVTSVDGLIGKMLQKYKNLEFWKVMRNTDMG